MNSIVLNNSPAAHFRSQAKELVLARYVCEQPVQLFDAIQNPLRRFGQPITPTLTLLRSFFISVIMELKILKDFTWCFRLTCDTLLRKIIDRISPKK